MRLSSSLIAVAVAAFGFLNGGEGTGTIRLISSAYAADLGRGGMKDSGVDSAPVEKVVSWSGVYIGAGVNYSIVNHELSAPGFEFDGISSDGFEGCGIAGVQRQMGRIVFGAEGRGCFANISTDLKIGSSEASIDLDDAYALYGKLGIAKGSWLLSGLAGYKWQHYSITGGSDDTVGGFSGGLLAELALDDSAHWVLGLEGIVTKYEQQDAGYLHIDPLQLSAGARLTYRFGY